MQEIRIINGIEYIFEVTENFMFAQEVCKQEFNGYKIKHETSCYTTNFYKVFGNERKHIGLLEYCQNNGKFYLWKFIKTQKHTYINGQEYAVNRSIIAKMRPDDYIYFIVDGSKTYKIRVEKALKVGNCKNFTYSGYNSELQLFIPISELTEVKKVSAENNIISADFKKGKKQA